ncbi:hypothetical protein DFA_02526 [Cavenderia fasciculata]|uniref:Carbohydrate binding domain-containing protein n=1 Tax=Cavenderia fasciculata TaxID=261658 RepID=F4PZM3_CACFS|nr:uncharacterized protein DFA_02526 [Cavenderia fasciculata]EGG18787.1 hypothetical protein DFA_02526 [Cavenderia fasciculata]|eukprot:XP_004357249.1 hypothetical protein DFA_02526 [Cavenderia fasciculata]
MTSISSIILLVLLLIVSIVLGSDPLNVDKEFVVKPEGKETVELVHQSLRCAITYEASGGSSETWAINIVDNGDGYMCMIGRPQPPSYILFKDITISFTNGKQSLHTAELMDNDGSLLIKDQFIIDDKHNVRPGRNWNKNLVLATLLL